MPPDDRRDEVNEWLRKATIDLLAAETLANATPEVAGNALYHCQQAAEKAIKGFLVLHDQVFRKTHSIAEVGRQAVQIDPSLEPIIKPAARLSDYIWKFRYPGTPFVPTGEEVAQGLSLAQAVIDAMTNRLSVSGET